MSPRAIDRINTYNPDWPMPKIFRIKKSGKIDESIFTGSTINTPSLMCVADYVSALEWAKKSGGLKKLIEIANTNLDIITQWVEKNNWISFLAQDKETISNTSVCLEFASKSPDGDDLDTAALSKDIQKILEEEQIGYDIGAYRDAPPGLRIWVGATVEPQDISILLEWIEWAYFSIIQKQ